MKLQQLLSYTRKAVDDYQMIEEGDKIAIGVSGGKDSLTLLYALKGLQRFYPKHFELTAVTVNLGFEGFDLTAVKQLCEELEVPYHVIDTEIEDIIFRVRKEAHPCSLCAKMRKGALNTAVKELGCNKVAYAHHRDDIIETMMCIGNFIASQLTGHIIKSSFAELSAERAGIFFLTDVKNDFSNL